MIKELTTIQKEQLTNFREECLQIGLSTDRIDRSKNQENINFFYKKYLGFNPPYIWYVDSPIMYNHILALLPKIVEKTKRLISNNSKNNTLLNLEDTLWETLKEDLVQSNIKDNIKDNLWNILGESLKDNFLDDLVQYQGNLGNNLANTLFGKIYDSVSESLRNYLVNFLWTTLRSNLRTNLYDNLYATIRTKDPNNNIFWGNWSIYWISYYMFTLLYLDVDYKDLNKDVTFLFEMAKNSGAIFCHKNICFISEKPIEINKKGIVLHADKKPAISYADGFCLWYLNGVRMPRQIVLSDPEDIDCATVLREKNVEVRREIVRKIGIDKVVRDLGAKSVEKSTDSIYELLNFDHIDGRFRPYLKMLNPSTGTWHIEGVHPSCLSIENALAWRNGENKYTKPDILT